MNPDPKDLPVRHRLPVARMGRDRYLHRARYLAPSLELPPGHVEIADHDTLLRLADRIRLHAEELHRPPVDITAGNLSGFGLEAETLSFLMARYRADVAPSAMAGWGLHLKGILGPTVLDALLGDVVADFPPPDVADDRVTPAEYLAGQTGNIPNREHVLAALLLLGTIRQNPALAPFRALLESPHLDTGWLDWTAKNADAFFATQPRFGPDQQTLPEVLQAPARAGNDLTGQLAFLAERWEQALPPALEQQLLRATDRIREEQTWSAGLAGPTRLPDFKAKAPEPAWSAPEQDWMPDVLLVAKNTPVWLFQLSERFGRPISRLDEIPTEVLAELVDLGFNALWLIGVWERSRASRRIKQTRGDVDALASAYSLFDYQIARALGGNSALANLRERADGLGLRLAADMVPNHTGIHSRWVLEHPDWFIGTDRPPFPGYEYNGPDLSDDPAIGICIEDGYWDGSDAAVSFERKDRSTQTVRYIYHGNDGTQMPWNDTAQLDFLNEEVRAAVRDTILSVARRFSIVRFDAAMTLTRFHFQRLWYPEPGRGGAIPSRSRFGLTREAFDEKMPREFWSEVVRAAAESAPDTLLMAEAFWMTESYFVGELGMHRVYNSAFMRMLSAEENGRYRAFLRDILATDPAILGRLVNFMTNPDEETALALFGSGDKYFGVATLLAALPGLPMFGHGQVEGLSEKYGMEFSRAYWNEQPNPDHLSRHRNDIAPLMRRRRLFSGTTHFRLYDLVLPDGTADDNVFAFSNGHGDQRVLVLYNNRHDSTAGRIQRSVPQMTPGNPGLRPVSLAEGLGLDPASSEPVELRDIRTGHEYSINPAELATEGLSVELNGYESRVLEVIWDRG